MRNFSPNVISAFALIFFTLNAAATIDITLQMQLGNPSGAIVDSSNHDHYLVQRTVQALDFSDNLGEPTWASWDLTSTDSGSAARSSSFFTDNTLPGTFYHVTTSDYAITSFTCPARPLNFTVIFHHD